MTAQLSIAPGTVFAGDYRVERPLGQGGMGAIFVCEQLSTGKTRALKLMHPTLVTDEEHRRRFEQEARVGSRIASEHVVEVVAAGVDQATGAPFIVMELLEGETLQGRLKRAGVMPVAELRVVFEQLCHAVTAAHAAGIVHRDLKPENVFLAHNRRAGGPSVNVKVLDFGIAKLVAEAGTRGTTGAMGSPLWMAPEQTEVGTVKPAADVWALGLIAFYALTGTFFWKSARDAQATVSQLFREIVLEDIPPASLRAGESRVESLLPQGFDAWFRKCLDRDPGKRYADAAECWRAMQVVFGEAPISGPVSSEEALAPTMMGAPASNGPPTPAPVTPAPATPASPVRSMPPASAIPQGTPPPLANTTPPARAGSVGPWILGAAAIVALAIVGSVVALTRTRGTEAASYQSTPSGTTVSYTRGAPEPNVTATAPASASASPPASASAPASAAAPAGLGVAAASSAKKPSGVATGGGVGKLWSWKFSGHTVHVQSGAITVSGNVPVDVVRSAMDWDGWEYLRCYERVYKDADTIPSGKVTLKFKIFDQLPQKGEVDKSDFSAPAFNECVKNTALGQTANAAGSSGFADVTYTLIFTVEK